MSAPEVTPNRRGVRSRELVLDTAERIMARHGFEGATSALIVEQSGIPASSVYHYFGSKQGVLLASAACIANAAQIKAGSYCKRTGGHESRGLRQDRGGAANSGAVFRWKPGVRWVSACCGGHWAGWDSTAR